MTTVAVSSVGYTGPVGREVVTAPTEPLLTLAAIAARLRLSHMDEHGDLYAFLTAATAEVESHLGRLVLPQTWRWWYDAPPSGLEVVLPEPARSVTVTTYSTADVAAVLSASQYTLDTRRARLVIDDTATWPPSDVRDTNALAIEATVGYASVAAVPAPIVQAVYLLIQGWYVRGAEPAAEGAARDAAVTRLLAPYRYRMGIA
jgi:uncharacterized phiE125 gp8 family phage protein